MQITAVLFGAAPVTVKCNAFKLARRVPTGLVTIDVKGLPVIVSAGTGNWNTLTIANCQRSRLLGHRLRQRLSKHLGWLRRWLRHQLRRDDEIRSHELLLSLLVSQ